jgi:hypothetical protein
VITEMAIGGILALAGFGVLLSVRPHIPACARIWLATPIGIAVYLFIALATVVFTGTLSPQVAIALTGAAGTVGLTVAARSRGLDRSEIRYAGLTLGIAVATVVVARIAHLTRLTPDSLRYLLASTDLVLPEALSELNKSDLVIRQIGLPALHVFSGSVGRQYVASIAPLFGVSGLGFFIWFTRSVTRGLGDRHRRWLVITAVLFLGTSNRLVYDSFYINAHIQMAVYLLIAVSCVWLSVTKEQSGWALPAGLALAATILLRPEAALVASIVLVAVAASRANWAVRIAVTVPAGLMMSLWYGIALWQNARGGDVVSLTAPVFGSMVSLFAAATLILAGGFTRPKVAVRHADQLMLVALVVLVVYLGWRTPEVLVDSAVSTFQNLIYDGLWLLTWVAALGLLLVAIVIHRIPDGRLWTTPIIGFAILFWLLPLLREGAYRVGEGDSGNRMLGHFLALVVAFLVLAAVERNTVSDPVDRGEIAPGAKHAATFGPDSPRH